MFEGAKKCTIITSKVIMLLYKLVLSEETLVVFNLQDLSSLNLYEIIDWSLVSSDDSLIYYPLADLQNYSSNFLTTLSIINSYFSIPQNVTYEHA